MYFFSEIDPNYKIKGSRDPLGFQTIWSGAGRKAIAHLSTVSANLHDFMILSYGRFFYGDRDDKYFLNFFFKFEQVCAYARYIYKIDKGFNGVEFVSKNKDNQSFSISLQSSDMLLSNQRTYGVYGKYTRPFRDMNLVNNDKLNDVLEKSLIKTDKVKLTEIINKLRTNDKVIINRDELKYIADLLMSLTEDEKRFYTDNILKVPESDHPQNNLYNLLNANESILKTKFNLHSVINTLQNESEISEELNSALQNIINTDKVLLPLNRTFLHLLSQPSWSIDQIKNDEFIKKLPTALDVDFRDETARKLNEVLHYKNNELVSKIIDRNAEVKNNPWVTEDKSGFKVIYGENGQKQKSLNYDSDYEFSYFLETYINLYKQIER